MIALLNLNLTIAMMALILSQSCNSKIGLGLLEIHGANRHQRGFFMRKISALHIMSGWAGSRKAGRVVCPVVQPAQSGAMIGLMMSGLKTFRTRDAIMNSSTQAQTEQNQPKTLNDLHKAFAELAFSYGMTCRGNRKLNLTDLAILQADCTLLACVTQELKNQLVGGAL